MKKIFVVLLIHAIAISLFATNTSYILAKSENSWMSLAPMPSARAGFGVAEVNGKIYAMGGWNKNQTNFLTANEMYDPATNSWSQKAPMLSARVSFSVAVYGDKIYTFGGQVLDSKGNRIVVSMTEVYDTATNTWATKTSLPQPAEDFGAALVGDKIYVIGTTTDVYDPATDSWTTKAPIPSAIAHSAYTVLDNKIYVMTGNYHGNNASLYQPINLNQIYDPQTDTWSNGAPVPKPVASGAAIATSGDLAPKAIYIVGGLDVTLNEAGGYVFNPQNLVQVYFPKNNSWTTGASMPTSRYSLSVVSVNDVLYALGGSYSMNPPDSADNEQYISFGYGTASTQGLPLTLIFSMVAIVAVVIALAIVVLKKRAKKQLHVVTL